MTFDRRYGLRDGQAMKAPARVATTENLPALSGLLTIDTVTVEEGDRVLVKDQTNKLFNGIWNASTGPWERAPDFDGYGDVVTGTRVLVLDGDISGGLEFKVTTADPVVFDSSEIEFEGFFVAGPPNSLSIGTVTEGPNADATITGSSPNQTLNLVLPTATDGDDATIAVGTVTTLAPGASATVVNSGTASAAVLDFGIPEGQPGADGNNGIDGHTISTGSTDPDNGDGNDGDLYFQTGTGDTGVLGDVWEKTSGTWGVIANIRGASGAGTGDMLAATYDPGNKNADAFAMANMVEGTTNKIFTATERTKLSGIEAAADVTDATNVAAAGAVMDGDFSANGLMVRTASGTYTSREIEVGTGLDVSNGDGVAGNPQIALDSATQASLALADTALQPGGGGSAYTSRFFDEDKASIAPSDTNATAYTYSSAAPVIATHRHVVDTLSTSVTAASGKVIEFEYSCIMSVSTTVELTLALVRDGTTIVDHCPGARLVGNNARGQMAAFFTATAPDSSAHTYSIYAFKSTSVTTSAWEGRRIRGRVCA